jgi:LytR cell envelope-related transcriptional attenuator
MALLLFAFSIQEQVEKYGAYVGLAAFLGLAVLTVLYFAQARELKRLRDWAGRAPERAQELEARVVAQADELRQAEAQGVEPVVERSGTVSPAQPIAKPAPATAAAAPSGNGRGAGKVAPIPPGPRPAVAVAAAAAQAQAAAPAPAAPAEDTGEEGAEPEAGPPTVIAPVAPGPDSTADTPPEAPAQPDAEEPSAPDEPAETPEEEQPAAEEPREAEPYEVPGDAERVTEHAGSGNGTGEVPAVIPRATPRPQPRPAPAAALRSSQPSRTATVPPRRGNAATARRDDGGSSRAGRLTLMVVGGIVAAAVVIFGATQLLGGDGNEPAPAPNVTQPPDETPGSGGGGGGGADVSAQRPDTVVVVLNGTATDGLAGDLGTKLTAEGYSSDEGMIRTGNNTDQQRQDSVVLYAPGKRRIARDVAQILGINARPEAVDADTLALANNTGAGAAGHETDVVVVAGADLAS